MKRTTETTANLNINTNDYVSVMMLLQRIESELKNYHYYYPIATVRKIAKILWNVHNARGSKKMGMNKEQSASIYFDLRTVSHLLKDRVDAYNAKNGYCMEKFIDLP